MCLQILHIVLVSLLFFLNKEILLEIFYGGGVIRVLSNIYVGTFVKINALFIINAFAQPSVSVA